MKALAVSSPSASMVPEVLEIRCRCVDLLAGFMLPELQVRFYLCSLMKLKSAFSFHPVSLSDIHISFVI